MKKLFRRTKARFDLEIAERRNRQGGGGFFVFAVFNEKMSAQIYTTIEQHATYNTYELTEGRRPKTERRICIFFLLRAFFNRTLNDEYIFV